MSATGLVRDPAGRLSALKIVVLLLVLLPGASLALDWSMHDLGPRPVTEVIHGTGLWAIRFLVITLAVTPARGLLDWPRVVMLRRMLGVASACYAVAHLTLYAVDQKWNLLKVVTEIALRFYLTIGFIALLGLLALAITSTDGWQKSLGRNWKRLHKLVFVIAPLALFHYGVQSKADVSDMVFLTGLFLWLVFWRLVPRRVQTKLWPLPGFALGAGLLAALIEAAWYLVRNSLSGDKVLQVLQANLDLDFGPRPAVAVVLAGLVLIAAVLMRRATKWLLRSRPSAPPARRAAPQRL
jgi:methionine sulfoxide reductase heme-binding subunit